jgi:hypothetical protein
MIAFLKRKIERKDVDFGLTLDFDSDSSEYEIFEIE